MVFTLLQNFISQEEMNGILAYLQFEDKARYYDVPTLLNYLVDAATFEWKSLRYAADVATEKGLKSIDYSTLSKRLGELNYLIVKRILARIISRLNRSARRSLKLKKELLATDSTTITVGENRLPWALYHSERSGIKLHVSFTNRTGMPLQIIETTGLKHDGPIGVELENKGFIIVADRAYFSIDIVDRYATTNQDFVIRLKDNVQLNRKKSLKRAAVEGSNIVADFTCTLGTTLKQTEERWAIESFLAGLNRI